MSIEGAAVANIVLGRGIRPIDEWPGMDVAEEKVAAASGDPRDWFTYDERLAAYHEMQERWESAYRRLRKLDRLPRQIEFGQTMIAGHQGAGKSVLVSAEAIHYVIRGHAFFHTGESWLFGRSLEGAERYEVLRRSPLFSIFAYDEAHTTFDSGLSNSTGLRGWKIQSAGFRKMNAKVFMPTAKVSMVAPSIREGASQVWQPLKVSIRRPALDEKLPNHNDPKNFVSVWRVWGNYPFQRADIIDGAPQDDRRSGLGAADQIRLRYGEVMRLAMLLTDTFQPVESAAAMQYALKDPMEAQRAAEAAGRNGGSMSEEQRRVARYLYDLTLSDSCPQYVKAPAVGYQCGVSAHSASRILSQWFGNMVGAYHAGKSAYRMEVLERALDAMFDFGDE